MTTQFTKDFVRNKICTDRRWTERAIIALYNRQTLDEQVTMSTRVHNNQGFNGVDAEYFSSLAEQLNKGRHLSDRQLASAQRSIGKYAGQLARIANGE